MLTSRFISWSRKSSFRPHGSGPSQGFPVREVGAEPGDLLADVGAGGRAHDLLGDCRRSTGRSRRQLPHAFAQPRLELHPAPSAARPCRSTRAASATRRASDPPAGARPRARIVSSSAIAASTAPSTSRPARPMTAGASADRSRTTSACGSRSRSPGVSGPATSLPARAPPARRPAAAPTPRCNSTSGAGGCRAGRTAQLDRPRASAAASSARNPLRRPAGSGQPELQVQVTMVTARMDTPTVARSSSRVSEANPVIEHRIRIGRRGKKMPRILESPFTGPLPLQAARSPLDVPAGFARPAAGPADRVQLGVRAAWAGQQLVVAARPRRRGRVDHDDRSARRTVESRWAMTIEVRSPSGPPAPPAPAAPIRYRGQRWPRRGSGSAVLQERPRDASRCRCPPDSRCPRSPISVW